MAEIKTVAIQSLGDLLDRVTPPQKDPSSGRFRDYAVYRGVADLRWKLLTSLDRLGGLEPPHTKVHLEKHIFRNFMRYSRPYLDQSPKDEWELLVTGQHHGLPTRLLDWTYSPLAAAHFATLEPRDDTDRVVWKLDWKAVHNYFGLPEVALLVGELAEALKMKGVASVSELFDEAEHARPFVCLLEPPTLDKRMEVQSGVFTLSSDKTRSLDDVLDQHGLEATLTRFIIPAASVDRIRDQLDLCSVDERRLFPDLDGVAAEMRRYYSTS